MTRVVQRNGRARPVFPFSAPLCVMAVTAWGGMAEAAISIWETGAALPGVPTALAVGKQGRLFAITANSLYTSADQAANWRLLKSNLDAGGNTPSALLVTDSALYVNLPTVESPNAIRCFRFADSSWSYLSAGLPADKVVWCFASGETVLLAGTNEGVFISRDKGRNWSPENRGLPAGTYVPGIHAFGSTWFIATNQGTSYRAEPDGSGWIWSDNGIRFPYSMAALGPYLFSASIESLRRSADAGKTWELDLAGLPLESAPGGIASDGMPKQVACAAGRAFVALQYGRATPPRSEVWQSSDSGSAWRKLEAQPTEGLLSILLGDGDLLYAVSAADGRIWKTRFEPATALPDPRKRSRSREAAGPRSGAPVPAAKRRFSPSGREAGPRAPDAHREWSIWFTR